MKMKLEGLLHEFPLDPATFLTFCRECKPMEVWGSLWFVESVSEEPNIKYPMCHKITVELVKAMPAHVPNKVLT